MLRGRVFAGLARAKAQGKKLGRPQVSAEKVEAIRLARPSGMGERRIARQLRVEVGTVWRLAPGILPPT
jgi:DNA invertase Pin-like site-specific DNA recombinase